MTRLAAFVRRLYSRAVLTHVALALGSFVLAWVLAAFVFFPDTGGPSTLAVPSVLGLRFDEAKKKLTEAGLRTQLGETRVSGSAPRNIVLAQRPIAGSLVEEGESVSLVVSGGQTRATIPTVIGLARDAAIEELKKAGFDAGPVYERTSQEARGTVLSSQPTAGQVVPEGTGVELVVSAGPSELTMPDLVGRELTEARSTFEQLGLKLGDIGYDSTSTSPPGIVLTQVPAAGSTVAPGATITLRVAGKP